MTELDGLFLPREVFELSDEVRQEIGRRDRLEEQAREASLQLTPYHPPPYVNERVCSV